MCFDGIISIRGLCTTDSAKYYLDDIGIGITLAAKAADDKYRTGKNLIEAKINQAWEAVVKDIKIKDFKFDKVLNDTIVGESGEDSLAASAEFRGQKFTLNKGCKLVKFFIHKVSVCVVTGGETTIKIKTATGETEIYSGTLEDNTTTEIVVNELFPDFQILVDNTNIEVCSGKNTFDCSCEHRHFTVTGHDGTSENYGITTDLQVRCDLTDYLCKYADKLAYAVQYKAAALIWKEIRDTNRMNNILDMQSDKAVAEMAWLDSSFNLLQYDPATDSNYTPKGMYQKELEKINIPIPKCKCCMECESDSYSYSIG